MVVCDTPAVHEAMLLGAKAALPDEIAFEDSPDVPVRCHYNRTEDAKKCAAVFQGVRDAWASEIDRIGFPPPQADEDGRLDVYIDANYRSGAYTTCPAYGDEIHGDGFTGCPAYIVLGWSIPEPAIADYLVHEFNHASQYAMDWKEWSLPIWEGVATAATWWTYPDVPPNSKDVGDYQSAAWLGILGDGYFLLGEYGLDSWFEYGSAAWVIHLDTVYGTGDGTVGGLALWADAAQEGGPFGNTVTVLDAYQAITGDWIAALMDFDVQRTRIGTVGNPAWASWAEPKSRLFLEPGVDATSLPTVITPEIAPYATGVTYVLVTGVEAGDTLHVEAQTEDAESSWGILAVQGDASDWATGATFDWVARKTDDGIVVGVVNLEQDEFATTGDRDDLRAGQSTLAIALSVTKKPAGDDTAAPAEDSIAPGDSSPPPAEDGEASGCGCGSGAGPSGWLAPLSFSLALRKRARPCLFEPKPRM